MRRGSYKGAVSIERILPLDSSTCLGVVVMLGTLCKAVALKSESLTAIVSILETFEQHMCVTKVVEFIPQNQKYNIAIHRNMIQPKALKALFNKLQLNFTRNLVAKIILSSYKGLFRYYSNTSFQRPILK